MFSKYAWSLLHMKTQHIEGVTKKVLIPQWNELRADINKVVWGLYIWKYSRRKRNKALQQKRPVKNRWSRRTGGEVHADPPAWIFPGQACDSNYITLKQIQIIDTLVAKFCKSPWCHATAWHFQDTRTSFSKPQQLWRHLEVPLQFRCIVLKPGRQHVSIHGYTVMEQPVARNLFQSLAAGIMLVEPQQSSDNSLCSHPVASKTKPIGNYLSQNSKKTRLWLQTRSQNLISKNEAIFGFA